MSEAGTFETCLSNLKCPFTGLDRKLRPSGQTDANDPKPENIRDLMPAPEAWL